MLHHTVMLLSCGILFLIVVPVIRAGNLTVDASTCVLTDIHSRLSIVSEIVESTRRKLSDVSDLQEICGKRQCKERPTNCSECPCQQKPTNCTECPCEEKPTNCSECIIKEIVEKPMDCSDIYRNRSNESGPYEIWPQSRISNGSVVVYCDMRDGGGWTVIQRRGDFGNVAENFDPDWNTYKTGFGDVQKEFWIGNDNIFALTNQRSYRIKFDLGDWEDNFKEAIYDNFWIDNEINKYTLHFGSYSGTAGDSLKYHNGMKFSTRDRKNDISVSNNCAQKHKGGWWYGNCFRANLNGPYLRGLRGKLDITAGVNWSHFNSDGYKYALKNASMKIRPMVF